MNHPLRFGVLGTGRITRKVAPAIGRVATLAAVGSRSAERAAAWMGEFGAGRSYGSYQALLDDPNLDAVYIALPPRLHHEWALKAAARGLHVLCEKPLAVTTADAAEMVAAARQHGVQLMDGVQWVHTPRAAAMRDVLQSGMLGDVQHVTSAFSFRPDNWNADEFRVQADQGGCLLDLGWYCVGMSLWAFGELPESVWGYGVERRASSNIAFHALLRFRQGGVARFDCNFQTAMRKWVEVAGTAGTLVCDDFPRPWSPEKSRFWLHDTWGKSEERRCDVTSQEDDLVNAFCGAVRSGTDPAWAAAALDVQRVCTALEESSRTGGFVTLSGERGQSCPR